MSGALDTINSFDEATKVGFSVRLSSKAVTGSLRISGQPLIGEQDIRLPSARELLMLDESKFLL